jgi:hypothetical protein
MLEHCLKTGIVFDPRNFTSAADHSGWATRHQKLISPDVLVIPLLVWALPLCRGAQIYLLRY